MYDTSYSTYETTSVDPAAGAVMAGFMMVYFLIIIAITIVAVVSMWRLFEKAGRPGWAAVVPIYNTIVALEVAGRPWWWIFLFFIPVANIVFAVIYMLEFARSYGKDNVYGILMLIFPYIMMPILAFSKDTKYLGPAGPEKGPGITGEPRQAEA